MDAYHGTTKNKDVWQHLQTKAEYMALSEVASKTI
jgi:hypothetical protein